METAEWPLAHRGQATVHHDVDRDDAPVCLAIPGLPRARRRAGIRLGPGQIERSLVLIFVSAPNESTHTAELLAIREGEAGSR